MRKHKPGPAKGFKKRPAGIRGFISRHKYAMASLAIVSAGAAGIVAVAKSLPVGAATAAGIAIGYLTVTAVGAVGAMSIRDGQVHLKATLEKHAVPA